MFEELSQRFEDAVKSLKGQASITETNVQGALKQVRRALLEAARDEANPIRTGPDGHPASSRAR